MSEHKIKLLIEVPQSQVEDCILQAIKLGFLRDDPKKTWKYDEKKRAVRWLIEHMLKSVVQ